jgi:pimeloyl-ACP methyl ester carboxylesterase
VVLIHGLGDSVAAWGRVRSELAGRVRVIAYDQRGCGASSTGDNAWAELVEDLRAVIAVLELQAPLLVGHSLGAGIALAAAASISDCRGVVLLDGAIPGPLPASDWSEFDRMMRNPFVRVTMTVLRRIRGGKLSFTEMRRMADDYHDRDAEFEAALRALECPVLYMLASQTPPGVQGPATLQAVRAAAAHAKELAPRVRVQWFDTGHEMPRRIPDEVARAILSFDGGRPAPA